MGDNEYKPMAQATVARDQSLSLAQAVRASAASFRDQIREIVGSEPIIEVCENAFTLATYGAGKYVEISRFSIKELPGCCGVAVFYHCSVATDFQKKGLGGLLLRLREESAHKAGYSFAQATVVKENKAEISILENNGWKSLAGFKSRRTNNSILVFGKDLRS